MLFIFAAHRADTHFRDAHLRRTSAHHLQRHARGRSQRSRLPALRAKIAVERAEAERQRLVRLAERQRLREDRIRDLVGAALRKKLIADFERARAAAENARNRALDAAHEKSLCSPGLRIAGRGSSVTSPSVTPIVYGEQRRRSPPTKRRGESVAPGLVHRRARLRASPARAVAILRAPSSPATPPGLRTPASKTPTPPPRARTSPRTFYETSQSSAQRERLVAAEASRYKCSSISWGREHPADATHVMSMVDAESRAARQQAEEMSVDVNIVTGRVFEDGLRRTMLANRAKPRLHRSVQRPFRASPSAARLRASPSSRSRAAAMDSLVRAAVASPRREVQGVSDWSHGGGYATSRCANICGVVGETLRANFQSFRALTPLSSAGYCIPYLNPSFC